VLQACDGRKVLKEFLREVLKKIHHLGDRGLHERIILKWILNIICGRV
jgi:hypothetical protein